jgi:cyanophycinase
MQCHPFLRQLVHFVVVVWAACLVVGRAESVSANEAASLPATATSGSLVILGGSERFDQRELWDEIVRLAGGPGSRIAVLPPATNDPYRKGGWVITALNQAGADAFLVPLAFRKTPQPPSEVAQDPQWVDQVREASGVFMIGGEQERIVQALQQADGEPTPMLEAMWDVYRRGGVIAGTSAGAAVMSRIMYRDAESVLQTLLNGVRMGKEIDRGLGFLHEDWFVDQHCFVRGRFARALVAMVDQGIKFGIGVDENSAVVVRQGQHLRVIGYKGALIMDLSRAEHDPQLGKFNLRNVRLTYLDRGDEFDLASLEVKPAAHKLDDEKLDPKSPEFRPYYKQKMFCNDILGNTTVVDLMGRLMDCVHAEAIGLAFDGAQALREAVDGFEFRFCRDEDSVAWYTESLGGDDYTVLNIRLDIRPIRLPGPLYEYSE